MKTTRRHFLTRAAGVAGAAAVVGATGISVVRAQTKKLRIGVGPLLPSPEDTKKAYTPVFTYLAKQLGMDFDLVATTDWAGMAVAMGSGQLDLAWMGPWGYIIANNSTGCNAVATVKYDEKPTYLAIVIAKPGIKSTKFPDDTKGLSISFADVGSTSGWLIPSYYAKEVWKIDPKTFWKYSEGATHGANEIAVSAGQVDMATDFDRNRNAMIESGKVSADSNKIIWTSAPLPNDAIVLPKDAPRELAARVQKILTSITVEQAKTLLPNHYTGFIASTHEYYAPIEKAGIAVGKIKPKA
jgi:phosphonate transport system substrate-binding protein